MKKITVVLLTLLLVSGLCACGKEAAKASAAPAATEAKDETVPATEAAAETTAAPETEAVPETTAAPETEAAEEETEAAAPEKEAIRPLHIVLEDVSLGNGENCYDTYQRAFLTEEDAAEYPILAEVFTDYNRQEDAASVSRMSGMTESYRELKEYREEDFILNAEKTTSVMRADSRIVSLYHNNYIDLGGAHPSYDYTGDTFDVESGKRLLLTDVVKDPEAFFDLLDEKLQEEYEEIYPYMESFADYRKQRKAEDYAFVQWVMSSEGMTVFFNPYELGPYAMGAQIITVFFDEAPELFYPEFLEVLPEYVLPVIPDIPMHLDLNADGKKEDFSIEWEGTGEPEEDYVYYYDFVVKADNRSVKLSDWCYSEESYVVRANDQYYLYLFETSDNDYTILAVVDLRTLDYDTEKSENAYLTAEWGEYIYTPEGGFESSSQSQAFTDPTNFDLGTTTQVLGTKTAVKNFHVGADGYPASEEAWYSLSSVACIRTKKDLTAILVNAEGEETGETVIPENTYLYFIRTDNETWADVQEIDASEVEVFADEWYEMITAKEDPAADASKPIYRLYVDKTEWPYQVGGESEEDALAGIMYAG